MRLIGRIFLAVRVLRGRGVIYRVNLTTGTAALNFTDPVPDVHVVDCRFQPGQVVHNQIGAK